jgi:hypothetical protein
MSMRVNVKGKFLVFLYVYVCLCVCSHAFTIVSLEYDHYFGIMYTHGTLLCGKYTQIHKIQCKLTIISRAFVFVGYVVVI